MLAEDVESVGKLMSAAPALANVVGILLVVGYFLKFLGSREAKERTLALETQKAFLKEIAEARTGAQNTIATVVAAQAKECAEATKAMLATFDRAIADARADRKTDTEVLARVVARVEDAVRALQNEVRDGAGKKGAEGIG